MFQQHLNDNENQFPNAKSENYTKLNSTNSIQNIHFPQCDYSLFEYAFSRQLLTHTDKKGKKNYNKKIMGKRENKTVRFIDLFAGIGGIRIGFERAFNKTSKTVFISEWDQYAKKTYEANFSDDIEIQGDITKINEKDIPPFDICLAGFPCQAFSMAGNKQGFEDNYKGLCRGTLFLDVARICEYHKPKVIFCENVKGLVIHDKGKTFKIIKKTFEDLGYKVFSKVLNSKDFGVPQNRERIYIVCFRKDISPVSFKFPESAGTNARLSDIIEDKPVSAK